MTKVFPSDMATDFRKRVDGIYGSIKVKKMSRDDAIQVSKGLSWG